MRFKGKRGKCGKPTAQSGFEKQDCILGKMLFYRQTSNVTDQDRAQKIRNQRQ